MMNISLSGALVQTEDFPHSDVCPGDTCSLLLSTDPTANFTEYTSRITRIGTATVALYFMSIDFPEDIYT
jgi:hypothetical protein